VQKVSKKPLSVIDNGFFEALAISDQLIITMLLWISL